MREKKERGLYIASILLLMLFPCTFLLMPIADMVPVQYARSVYALVGGMFWITCIGGYVSLGIVYAMEKQQKRQSRRTYLFSNSLTVTADIMFVLGCVGILLLSAYGLTSIYMMYVSIFLSILAWDMHWLFSRGYQKKILHNVQKAVGGKGK